VRCFARYIWKRRLSGKKRLEIETLAGIIRPERAGELVRVDMGEPVLEGSLIPTTASGSVVDRKLRAGGKTFEATCVSMGNPHCVIFVNDVDGFDVGKYGPILERDKFFPKRTNVEFVEVASRRRLRMRVFERAAGETLACGTGACATLVAASIKGLAGRTATVELRGGVLLIEWATDNHVYMTGPAVEVFIGTAVL
jgi:diaminopimelate epimerase